MHLESGGCRCALQVQAMLPGPRRNAYTDEACEFLSRGEKTGRKHLLRTTVHVVVPCVELGDRHIATCACERLPVIEFMGICMRSCCRVPTLIWTPATPSLTTTLAMCQTGTDTLAPIPTLTLT
jgi:hypothetical protein